MFGVATTLNFTQKGDAINDFPALSIVEIPDPGLYNSHGSCLAAC